jgi:hypothetical protein
MALADAVVDAGAVRFRPMMLTAAAVIVGSGVILFDPIFQGLAISLMAGEVASLLLSRMTVPVLFYMSERRKAAQKIIEVPSFERESVEEAELPEIEPVEQVAESATDAEPASTVEPLAEVVDQLSPEPSDATITTVSKESQGGAKVA